MADAMGPVGAHAASSGGGILGLLAAASTAIARLLGTSPQAVSSTLAIFLVSGIALAFPSAARWLSGGKYQVSARVTFLIVAYSVCSSMLLILNKVAVTYLPAPSFILLAQLSSCALFIRCLASAGVVECEKLERAKVKKFALIVFGFIGTLFANVSTLKHVPVDTIICFRASTPLVIAVIEYFHLGRELPSARSWAALGGVFLGVASYTAADANFTAVGYAWLGVWYSFAVLEMVWVKQVVDSVAMSTWSRSFYQNALAVPPMLVVSVVTGEMAIVLQQGMTSTSSFAWAMVAASCVAGLGMSYFSFALRAVISATSFSVIGNVCKVLTILVNMMMWDQHSNATGTAALFFCLLMGSFYQQPPMRRGAQVSSTAVGLGGVLSAVKAGVGGVFGAGGKSISSGSGSSGLLSSAGIGGGSGKTSPAVSLRLEEGDRIAAHKGGVAVAV